MPSERQRRLRKLGNAIRASMQGDKGAAERAQRWFRRGRIAGDIVQGEDKDGNVHWLVKRPPYVDGAAH